MKEVGLFKFFKKEFGFNPEAESYKLYRVFLLIGIFFAPLTTFFLFGENTIRNIYLDITIPFLFVLVLIGSFVDRRVRDHIKLLFFIVVVYATFYASFNMYSSGFRITDFIGFLIAYFAISIGFQDYRYSIFYTLSNLVLLGVLILLKPEGEVYPVGIVVLVLLIGIVSFVIHYNRFLLLAKLQENRTELSGSRDRLLTVLDSIDKVVYNVSIDEKGNKSLRYVSKSIEHVLGLTIDEYFTEIKSGRIIERIHPEDLPGVVERSRILSEKCIPVSMVYRFLHKDGYIWIEEKVFPKVDDNGRHIASIGISSDVTLQVNSENALRLSEERYRSIIEKNLAGFYRIDLNNVLIDCNDAFANIMGFVSKNDIVGKSINDVYLDSSDKDKFISLLKSQVYVRNHESMLTLQGGKKIWLLENVSLIRDKLGEAQFIEGTAFDITDLKVAQLEIQKAQDSLTMVIDNIDSLVYSLDIFPDGRKEFNFLGKQIERLIGLPKQEYIEEVKSGRINQFFHPDDLRHVVEQLTDIKKHRGHGTFRYRFLHRKSEEYVWLEENIYPQFDEEGRIYRNFGVVRDISDNIRYENALKRSESSYRNLFEHNLAGVFKTTVSGKILDCNDAFVNIFGYSGKAEIIQATSRDFYQVDEDRQNYLNDLRQKGYLTNYEITYKKKNGDKVRGLVNVTLFEEDGQEILLGTLIDITELKDTAQALIDKEKKFRLLFEVANDAILILKNGIIVDCNERTAEMLQAPLKEIMNKEMLFFASDLQPNGIPSEAKWKKKYESVVDGNSQFFYWKMLRTDGKYFDTEVSLNSFQLGDEIFVQAMVRDITQRMKAEMAQRDSEERFKLLANSTVEGIVFSEGAKIIDCNEQTASILGYDSRKEIIGKSLFDFIISDDHELTKQRLSSDQDDLVELRVRKKDGTVIYMDTKGKYIPYESRMVRVSVIMDVTQRKLSEESILRSKKAYEELVESSPYGIFIHRDGEVIYANRSAFDIVGVKREEFIPGMYSMYDFMLPEYVEESYQRRNRLMEGEEVPFIRVKLKKLNGEIIDVETKSQLITYQDETVIQSTFKDISAEMKLQQEILRAEVAEAGKKRLEEEVNEHKRTQQKLLEIQKYTQSIIGSSIDMIIATDTENNINEVNPAALRTFGYKREELIGQHPGILYANRSEYAKIKESLSNEEHFSGEILNKRKNGEIFTSYISASLIRDNEGHMVGAMGVSRDITEIIEAEKIVQEQNAKIKSIFENTSNMLMWTMDRKFRITSYNKNFKDIIESRFEIPVSLGADFRMGLSKLISEDIFQPLVERYMSAFAGEPQELEGPLTTPSGEKFWFETFLNPILLEDEEIEEISCVSHDITEKKKAQRELRLSEERNKAMITALPDLIFRMSFDGRFLDVIYKRESQLYEPASEFIGKNITERFKGQLGKSFLDNIQHAIVNNQIVQFEYDTHVAENRQFFEARYAKINDDEALVIIRDITEKKQAEVDLRNSLKEKEVLLKEVHHRVKNNLQVISSILNLQSSYVKDDNTLHILRESQNRIKSMSFIHESLYQTKNFSSVNFSEYIINLSKNLVHSYQVYGDFVELDYQVGNIRLNLDQSIPCGLIVNELVSNALKYAFGEGQKGIIRVELQEEEGQITLMVSDDGKGLPEGFDYNTTETLGLQLVLTLTEQLDGMLQLDSSPGKGTKYLITFEKLI